MSDTAQDPWAAADRENRAIEESIRRLGELLRRVQREQQKTRKMIADMKRMVDEQETWHSSEAQVEENGGSGPTGKGGNWQNGGKSAKTWWFCEN